jgi:hypothetical protein
MSTPRWTVTALTIPGRENYLRQLIQSLEATVIPGGARLVIVYNRAIRDELADVERSIRSWVSEIEVEVHFNNGDPTISGGRNYQLNLVNSPLVCFVDDDVTVHGDAFLTIEEAMQRYPRPLRAPFPSRGHRGAVQAPDGVRHYREFFISPCKACWSEATNCSGTSADSIRDAASG